MGDRSGFQNQLNKEKTKKEKKFYFIPKPMLLTISFPVWLLPGPSLSHIKSDIFWYQAGSEHLASEFRMVYLMCAKLLKHQGVGQMPQDRDLKEQSSRLVLLRSRLYNQIAELDEHPFCY